MRELEKYIILFIATVTCYFLISCSFGIRVYKTSGPSMSPSLSDPGIAVVKKNTEYSRGDIAIINMPGKILIKRIIGIPGDKILLKNGILFINGVKQSEEYVEHKGSTSRQVLLRSNYYYIMGDNRKNSLDSRNFGPIKKHLLVGKAIFLW